MSEGVVTATLWVIAACLAIGWLAGLVSLRMNEQDWSRELPAKAEVSHRAPSWCGRSFRSSYCP